MSTVRELHTEAMTLAQQALVKREAGNPAEAASLAASALTYELDAADLLAKIPSSEPTSSILYQSATSLTQQPGDLGEAQRLIAEALSGYLPPRVEHNLKQLLEEITSAAHRRRDGGPRARPLLSAGRRSSQSKR